MPSPSDSGTRMPPGAPSYSTKRPASVSQPSSPSTEAQSNNGAASPYVPASGQAQRPGPTERSQGILTAVNVPASTFSIGITATAGAREFRVTTGTAIFVGTERIAFDRLHEFMGTPVSVWSAQVDASQLAGRIVLFAAASATGSGGVTAGGVQNAVPPIGASPGPTASNGSGGATGSSSG